MVYEGISSARFCPRNFLLCGTYHKLLELAIMYLFSSRKYLSFSNSFLKYTSEASMPFYVLHQPIIVFLSFFIRELSWSIPAKLLFLILTSFILIMVCYHFVIRCLNILRFLFGMKGNKLVIQRDHAQTNYAKYKYSTNGWFS